MTLSHDKYRPRIHLSFENCSRLKDVPRIWVSSISNLSYYSICLPWNVQIESIKVIHEMEYRVYRSFILWLSSSVVIWRRWVWRHRGWRKTIEWDKWWRMPLSSFFKKTSRHVIEKKSPFRSQAKTKYLSKFNRVETLQMDNRYIITTNNTTLEIDDVMYLGYKDTTGFG